ncbi:hypothetical protein AHF37_06658 [Paragonimus kellicotti]|nr:hypothetical protein AHF37_06658 [Paragonimus kellicotti]
MMIHNSNRFHILLVSAARFFKNIFLDKQIFWNCTYAQF